jgi:hypothetical protein
MFEVNEPEPSCPRCGWRIPEPLGGSREPGAYWNAWAARCMRREPDGTYTMLCPQCRVIRGAEVPVIGGLVYKGGR